MKLFALLVFLSSMLLAASCGGSGSTLPEEPDTSPAAGPAALPPPSTLRQVSYDPARLVCCGADYITTAGFPRQNICTEDQCCGFAPDWTPAEPDSSGLAYACYGFDMEGYDRAERITFSWTGQGDPADLWIGLADFSRNCWSWHQPEAGSSLELTLAPYIDAETRRMLVLPLVTGTAAWQLSRIHVGDLASLSGVVFADDGVSPLYDVHVVLDGDQEYAVRTDYDGTWRIDGVLPGDYEARAELIGWSFVPESQQLTVDRLQHELGDFTGSPLPVHDVSGMVLDDKAGPLRGVELKILRQDSPYGGVSTWTEFDGSWVTGLPDGDYTVTPELVCWTFTPESRNFSVAGGPVVVDDFVGDAEVARFRGEGPAHQFGRH
ncbi:MAG TPA: carboxypeptidase regulatory-like domain-containing protein, partial [Firmicutes bacterium]|nr:carboxypeptidase regulatory-like domain-containing protein [Bacillota bacterium]